MSVLWLVVSGVFLILFCLWWRDVQRRSSARVFAGLPVRGSILGAWWRSPYARLRANDPAAAQVLDEALHNHGRRIRPTVERRGRKPGLWG